MSKKKRRNMNEETEIQKCEEPRPIDSGAPKITHKKKESREGMEENTHRCAEQD
jgi:hypothetical protein